jgi:hypothetical protein
MEEYNTTIDTYLRMFQYKIFNNILYLNRDLHRFNILDYSSCSFCLLHPETVDHLFVECIEEFEFFLPESNKSSIILGVEDNSINFIILVINQHYIKEERKERSPLFLYFKI